MRSLVQEEGPFLTLLLACVSGFSFLIALLLIVVGGFAVQFVSGSKREDMTSKRFRLVDHYANLREKLALSVPSAVQRVAEIFRSLLAYIDYVPLRLGYGRK